jgi:formate dehydrogenase major subunit
VPGLGASFGRGAATTYQQDLANSDCILLMGSNMAEAHPVGFRWPMKAKANGGKLIHVDPRFSRTSALCDEYVQIRAGSDIAFLGGVIRHVLTHKLYFKEFVDAYTNASVLIEDGFRDTEDLAGLFSGYDTTQGFYNPQDGHWGYARQDGKAGDGGGHAKTEDAKPGMHGYGLMGGAEPGADPKHDPTLQDPMCVWQLLHRHFERYTPETVAEICGCQPGDVVKVAEMLAANSGRERTSAIVYAVGWTHHTTGVQIIRAAGILQLLLGNIGRPGAGVMAMRGHSSIQGSTDVSTLYDLMPGYLPQPTADARHEHLADYIEAEGTKTGYWANYGKFVVSQLKAWYGAAATPANEFGFNWLPRLDGDYSYLLAFDRMARGEMSGYLVLGQNPAGGGINAGLQRAALRSLDWLVVMDWFETETAVFWKDDPTGPPAADIKTEVFFIPAASSTEKEGTLTNTQRLLQWHNKALDPPGDCRSDAWFTYNLGKRLKALYAGSTDTKDQPLLNLTWDYDHDAPSKLPDGSVSRIEGEPDVERILQEVNGYAVNEIDPQTGRPKLLSGFSDLKDDGSTACGCWIYSGVFPDPGRNRANERTRTPDNPIEPNWGYAWPHNRRVLYNRASADPAGNPWSERKKLVWWDRWKGRWVGPDEPDFEPTKPPSYRPPDGAKGMDAIGGDKPFIMKPDGLGWLYAAKGVKDGPLPTHYEPVESPLANALYPRQSSCPTVRTLPGPLNPLAQSPTTEFPVVATTFRLTEHYLSGPMSRFNSWLNELMPEMFVEVSPELAAEVGVGNGDWVTVRTPRGAIVCRAMVTRRVRPLKHGDRWVHQVGLPFHWAFAGEVVGGNANDLTALLAEANVSIHEAKAFTCRLEPGPAGGPGLTATKKAKPWPTREPVPDTPAAAQPEGGFAHGS